MFEVAAWELTSNLLGSHRPSAPQLSYLMSLSPSSVLIMSTKVLVAMTMATKAYCNWKIN